MSMATSFIEVWDFKRQYNFFKDITKMSQRN